MSFFDMIPSELLTMPSGRHGTRRIAQKNFGLLESTCAYCGKTFYRSGHEVEYTRHRGDKTLRFCTWTHLCAWERENPRTRKKGGSAKTLQERIDDRMRKMSKDRTLLDSEEGMDMTQEERKKIQSRLAWRGKELRDLLEDMENEGACGVRGIAGGDDRAAQDGP